MLKHIPLINRKLDTYCLYILIDAGIALIKPTNLLFLVTRTPQCHCSSQPGGCKALLTFKQEHKKLLLFQYKTAVYLLI
jgi:hypothetical protein